MQRLLVDGGAAFKLSTLNKLNKFNFAQRINVNVTGLTAVTIFWPLTPKVTR